MSIGVRPWTAVVVALGLASRAFAAGDVVAEIDEAGALRLEGDDLANDVQVDRDPLTREFVVRGRNATTVNGAAEWRAPTARALRVEMGAGDDVVATGGFRVPGGLVADMGDGTTRSRCSRYASAGARSGSAASATTS